MGAGLLVRSATSWATTRIVMSWCTASNRSPEEHCSTPVPHHAAGGRLSLDGPLPGEQGSIPEQRSGPGMDPPGFWAGNTGKSRTTHPVSPGPSALKRSKGEQSGWMGQSAFCQAARSEWAFRFQLPQLFGLLQFQLFHQFNIGFISRVLKSLTAECPQDLTAWKRRRRQPEIAPLLPVAPIP